MSSPRPSRVAAFLAAVAPRAPRTLLDHWWLLDVSAAVLFVTAALLLVAAAQGTAPAAAHLQDSRRRIDQSRAVLAELRQEENQLLAGQRDAAERVRADAQRGHTVTLALATALLAVSGAGVIALLLRRQRLQRHVA